MNITANCWGNQEQRRNKWGENERKAKDVIVFPSPISKVMSQAINRGKKKKTHSIKVAMVGDPQIGKTSLMVKYVEGKFNEDYIQTLGNCVEL